MTEGNYRCLVRVEKIDRAVHADGSATEETILVACGFTVPRNDVGTPIMKAHLHDVHGVDVPMGDLISPEEEG